MKKNQIAISLGIICLILAMGIAVQIRTIKGNVSNDYIGLADNDLRDEALKWKERYDRATKQLNDYEKRLARIRTETSQDDDNTSSKEKQIRNNNILLGLTDVEGKGIEITIKDDPNASTQTISVLEDISSHIVHDGDLRVIVNELKNAGAEAISINDQRLVSTSAITCIGNVIKVNDEKVSSPFVIKAIGFPERMESALKRGGGFLDFLDDFGIEITIKKSDNIFINKFSGVISSKYME